MFNSGDLGAEKAPGLRPDLNPSPLYLELISVGQLGLELTVGQLGGFQVTLETLEPLLQLPRLHASIFSFHSQR